MARWVMKHYVESDLGLRPELSGLSFKHPTGKYEVYLENHDIKPGSELPLLVAHVVFEAPTIEEAKTRGERLIVQILDQLAFSTRTRFRLHRTFCLFDWGNDEWHAGQVYALFANPDRPQQLLGNELASFLELLNSVDSARELVRAQHWISTAVGEEDADQQFQFFWFALETLARLKAKKEKVPDRCSRCREPLYCPACKEVPTHRPYPNQHIKSIFDRFSDDADRLFKVASSTRHAMLHADDLDAVEKENGFTVADLVDIVGDLAWRALLEAVVLGMPQEAGVRLETVLPSSLLRRRQRVQLDVRLQLGSEPSFASLPNPETLKVSMIVGEGGKTGGAS
jgi:hypothetical protein